MSVAAHAPGARGVGGSGSGPSGRNEQGTRWTLALCGLLLVASAAILLAGRGTSFFFDEWDWILHSRGHSPSVLLAPHNGHLVVLPLLLYKAMLQIFGLRHYWPYRVLMLACHILLCVLIYLVARRRLERPLAVLVVVPLAFAGWGWQDVLWSFQLTFVGALAGGVGAMLTLERTGRRADIGSAALLTVSLACSGVGVAFLFAAAVVVAMRRQWRRLWVVAVPAVLFGAWYLRYGTSTLELSAIWNAPGYVADAIAGAVGGTIGLSVEWGRVGAFAGVGLVAAHILRHRSVSPQLGFVLAAGLGFWVLTALGRLSLSDPADSRYVYAGIVFVLLAAIELARGMRPGPTALALLAVGAAAVALADLGQLRAGGQQWRALDATVRVELSAVQLLGDRAPAGLQPDPQRAPQITAGPYLHAIKDFGSPAPAPATLPRQSPALQAAADGVLESGAEVALVPGAPWQLATAPPPVAATLGGVLRRRGACDVFTPRSVPAMLDLTVAPGRRIVLSAPGQGAVLVYLRRFAPAFPASPFGTLPAGSQAGLSTLPDAEAGVPWQVRLAPAGPVRACAAV